MDVVGWILGLAVLVLPVVFAIGLDWATITGDFWLSILAGAWVVATLGHFLYVPFSEGSEFERWSTLYGKAANRYAGRVEALSRLVRERWRVPAKSSGKALPSPSGEEVRRTIRSVLTEIVDLSCESVPRWVSFPTGTRFRAFLVVPVGDGSMVEISAHDKDTKPLQLPFDRAAAAEIQGKLAYATVHPLTVEDTKDRRYGNRYDAWWRHSFRSFVSLPIVVGGVGGDWLGCLNVESTEPYVFQKALVQGLLMDVLRPHTELLGLALTYGEVPTVSLASAGAVSYYLGVQE